MLGNFWLVFTTTVDPIKVLWKSLFRNFHLIATFFSILILIMTVRAFQLLKTSEQWGCCRCVSLQCLQCMVRSLNKEMDHQVKVRNVGTKLYMEERKLHIQERITKISAKLLVNYSLRYNWLRHLSLTSILAGQSCAHSLPVNVALFYFIYYFIYYSFIARATNCWCHFAFFNIEWKIERTVSAILS